MNFDHLCFIIYYIIYVYFIFIIHIIIHFIFIFIRKNRLILFFDLSLFFQRRNNHKKFY